MGRSLSPRLGGWEPPEWHAVSQIRAASPDRRDDWRRAGDVAVEVSCAGGIVGDGGGMATALGGNGGGRDPAVVHRIRAAACGGGRHAGTRGCHRRSAPSGAAGVGKEDGQIWLLAQIRHVLGWEPSLVVVQVV